MFICLNDCSVSQVFEGGSSYLWREKIKIINLCFPNYQKLISLQQIFLSARNKADMSRPSASINQFNAHCPLCFLIQYLSGGI